VNEWFERTYDQGLILIDSSSNNHVFFFDIPTERFLQEGVYGEWKAALDAPGRYVDWIYMQRGGTGTLRDRIYDVLADDPQLKGFVPVMESNGFAIYLRADRYPAWAAAHIAPVSQTPSVVAAPQAASPVVEAPATSYTVQPGDTLIAIAARFAPPGVSALDYAAAITARNRLGADGRIDAGSSGRP
jgi:hypothetical protein